MRMKNKLSPLMRMGSKKFEKGQAVGLKKNHLIRFFIDTDLKGKIERAKVILNQNDYLDVDSSNLCRQALRYYINMIETHRVGLAFMELNTKDKKKQKKEKIIDDDDENVTEDYDNED